ncbi:MAG: SWIM zinc finger family protein [Ferruginibacter sp.]|nr:SWIM zinc finger family protein [Cytophagales bacterium]
MQFNYKFGGATAVASGANAVDMAFAPDLYRQPTYFRGTLAKNVAFREAISALHHVVVSDLRFKPQDKTAYQEWAAQNELRLLAQLTEQRGPVKARMDALEGELDVLRQGRAKVMKPFYEAQRRFFDYAYQKERDLWFVLDPVITVHPDEVFFECFSQDESSYGRLGCSYEVFQNIGDFACGTTNIDYSAALYNEFQKIRDYKETHFTIDPSGFEVQTTHEDAFTEVKIDLPDSWVRGFLQVSSAMTLPTKSFDLHPMDVHNLCHVLRRRKETVGPRSVRFLLQPGEPIRMVFEPWNLTVPCPRSIYTGREADEIRLWGRRRLLVLERLVPVARKFTVHLLGSGLPSFFVADLGDLTFTLGLSGWTANDWSRAGNFDLMAPRTTADSLTKERVFEALRTDWQASSASLAQRLGLDRSLVEGALSAYAQAGRVMYDLHKKVYRARELSQEPLPTEKLRFNNPREAKATQLVDAKEVTVKPEFLPEGNLKLSGTVREGKQQYAPELVIDRDERIAQATCTCHFYHQNKLYKGPCEHILALRMAHQQKNWFAKFIHLQ